MRKGKAFEVFVKRLLISVGFTEVNSDGLYIFDGAPGQMIQGLGEAHNADVLLEPPVQTPFYAQTRLLIECKDYSKRVGLDTVRSALGLREDINHFDIVDINELVTRRGQRRVGNVCYTRYLYQVAIASISGFSMKAQKFAATHRISLIEFDKLPFWGDLEAIMHIGDWEHSDVRNELDISERQLQDVMEKIGNHMALAITNSGQILFLYHCGNREIDFSDNRYSIYWEDSQQPWRLVSGGEEYLFQLPQYVMKYWLENSVNELEMRKAAINCKSAFLSNMVVYYMNGEMPQIKMISIDQYELKEAKRRLKMRREDAFGSQ